MNLSTKYNINDKVYIKELKIWGKVISILFDCNLQYNVRFFNSYDPKICYFHEDELSLQENEEIIGFKKDNIKVDTVYES